MLLADSDKELISSSDRKLDLTNCSGEIEPFDKDHSHVCVDELQLNYTDSVIRVQFEQRKVVIHFI
jgi:hypothetical protein